MREKELRRSLSVLPMGTVIKLTGLTARQIRYYEEKRLVSPKRSRGNRRLYSLNDVDRILDIKDDLNSGLKIADIQKRIQRLQSSHDQNSAFQPMSDNEARRLLKGELLKMGRLDSDYSAYHNNYPV